MMKRQTAVSLSVFVFLVVVAGFCVAFGMAKKQQESIQPVTRTRVVKLFRVGQDQANFDVIYPGRVQPLKHAELFFRVSGPVIEQHLKFGQTVDEGAVLMRIDPRDYEREVERLSHEIEMQKVKMDLANTEYLRQKQLVEENAVSRSAYDSAFTSKQTQEAQLKILETSLKIAQDKLKDTVLTAPFHGTVSDILIEQNENAQAGVPVVTLQNLRDLEIKINVPAGNLPQMSIYDAPKRYHQMEFPVSFPGRGPRRFMAKIREFKPMASGESEMYELSLSMKQPDDFGVLPGMTAEVHGLPNLKKTAGDDLQLPFAAVFQRDGKPSVWIYHPDTKKLELRHIQTDVSLPGNKISVSGQLKSDDLVVAAGGDWLDVNTPVKIMNPEILR